MAYMDENSRVHAWEMSPPKRNPDDMSFDELQEEELEEEDDDDAEDPPPKSEARPPRPDAPPVPESVTALAVTVPLVAVMPVTTSESPGRIALRPTDCDLVTFATDGTTTSTVPPAVVVT